MSIITRSGFFKRGYNLAPATPSGGFYPNLPVGYTNNSGLGFSQTVPVGGVGTDVAIAGTDWFTYVGADGTPPFASQWTKTLDATAPQSPPYTWVGHWAPGTFSTGHGIGNVSTYGPSNIFLSVPTTRIYISIKLYLQFPDISYFQPISNKFLNIFGNHSTILMQLKEAANYRHCEELGNGDPYFNFYVDNGVSVPGETHIPGQLSNGAIPINQWVQLEIQIDITNNIFKVWQDGVLTTSATPTFASTNMNTIGIYAFRGGGGETLDADLYYKYDNLYIAW